MAEIPFPKHLTDALVLGIRLLPTSEPPPPSSRYRLKAEQVPEEVILVKKPT